MIYREVGKSEKLGHRARCVIEKKHLDRKTCKRDKIGKGTCQKEELERAIRRIGGERSRLESKHCRETKRLRRWSTREF